MTATPIPARALYVLVLLCLLVLAGGAQLRAADEEWLIGTWELHYDPDGARTDWLIFEPDGDVISRGPQGREFHGMYISTPEGVKTVFTHEGQDVIATFHHGDDRQVLKIVTSASGEESVYRKVD